MSKQDKTSVEITFSELRRQGLDDRMVRELRSDHAGETGAVAIYEGILAVSRDPAIRQFASEHLQTERRHLAFFDEFLPSTAKTRLTSVWRVAGFLTGALPALIGRRAVFLTIESVEEFVDKHYAGQIDKLAENPSLHPLQDRLDHFRSDEVHHRRDAAGRVGTSIDPIGQVWRRLVGAGSSLGVSVARRI
jgi:ubiquinone biosynthesis monooxygenase Coq7